MRMIIIPIILVVLSCGESSSKEVDSSAPVATQENTLLDDFGAVVSEDGKRAVFTSRREARTYKTYLYDESKNPKWFALYKTIELGEGEQEYLTTSNNDASWVLTWRESPSTSYLLLNNFNGSSSTKLLTVGSKVREIALAPTGNQVLGFVSNTSSVDATMLYSFTSGSSLILTKEATLSGETHPQFVMVGADLYVFTHVLESNGSVKIKLRKRSSGTWLEQSISQAINAIDARMPSVATSKGLYFGKNLRTPRLRKKLGTYEDKSKDYVANVGVISEWDHFASFSGAVVDMALGNLQNYAPLSLIDISATADGEYLLLTGNEVYFCKNKTLSTHALNLFRLSDGAVIPLHSTRETSTLPWTNLISNPCDYFDEETPAKNLDFDIQIGKAKIISVNGNSFQIAYETRASGDRETWRTSFQVSDWANKNIRDVIFTNMTQNTEIK